jgi:hypothetical protein
MVSLTQSFDVMHSKLVTLNFVYGIGTSECDLSQSRFVLFLCIFAITHSDGWPHGTLCPQKLALTSHTSGGCSV